MSGVNLFNNGQRSGYEELISYYPIFYRDVREMDAILQICGGMLDGMASAMEATVLNRFIDTMDEEATGRMETFLYLTENQDRPLGERKRLIHALLVGHGKMSASKIKEVVEVFTGLPAEIEFIKEYILIRIPLEGVYQFTFTDIKRTLGNRIPAHLTFYFSFLIRNIKVSVNYENTIHLKTGFYPRYNLPFLNLDNTWKLDGRRKLNGYKSDSRLDFYPVSLYVQASVQERAETKQRFRVFSGAREEISLSTGYKIQTEARASPKREDQLTLQTTAAEQITTGSVRVMNLNKLDKQWKLDGRRKLNGGLSIL